MTRLPTRDLAELIAAVTEETRIPARILEKDYWATEVLRILVTDCAGTFLFKGGTSLSKAYGLLDRYSEDLDLLVLADANDTPTVIARLDALHAAAQRAMGSLGVATEKDRSTDELYRVITVSFPARTKNVPGVEKTIRLEPGVRGGPLPHETRPVRSLVSEHAPEDYRARVESFDDGTAFNCEVLHPARTLVEKLLAVHTLAEHLANGTRDKVPHRFARHFYDLHQLCAPDGPALSHLRDSGDYMTILGDCQQVSRQWFTGGVEVPLPAGGLTASRAFHDAELRHTLEVAYRQACANLCFPGADRPTWDAMCNRVTAAASTLT